MPTVLMAVVSKRFLNRLARKASLAIVGGIAEKIGEAIGDRIARRLDPDGYVQVKPKEEETDEGHSRDGD